MTNKTAATEDTPENTRWQSADRDLPRRIALVQQADDEVYLCDSDPLTDYPGEPLSYAYSSLTTVDPDDFFASFSPLTVYRLRMTINYAEPHPEVTNQAYRLLSQWINTLGGPARQSSPHASDNVAMVTWPSRDTVIIPALRAHGFVPTTSVAIASLDRPGRAERPSSDVVIRQATLADLDVLVDMQLHGVDYDVATGSCRPRPSLAAAAREALERDIVRSPGSRLIAEIDGQAAGIAMVDEPEHSDWIATYTSRPSPAYFDAMAVREEFRGRGVGSALVDAAHHYLREAGVKTALLHHGTLNPLSTPFWYSHGYRPLWTTWELPVAS